jgi:chromosome partitioning protein
MSINIVIANQKGGVGKTTSASSLAHGLVLRNRRILLVDFDPQGQCATALGVGQEPGIFISVLVNPRSDIHQWIRDTGRTGLDLLPGDRSTATAQIVINAENRPVDSIRMLFRPLGKEYDYIIFDTAPSVGGIQERAIYAADLTLIPTATEFLSMNGLAQMVEVLNSLRDQHHWPGKLAGILPTFFDEQTSESNKSLAELKANFDESVLSPIHRATILRECAAEGKTIFEMDPASRAAREYEELSRVVVKLS